MALFKLLIILQATQLWQSYKEGAQLIWTNRPILWIGIVQSIIESCMYIFVFLWTPVLLIPKNNEVPLGMIFSCFMVCIMIGSSIFSWFNTKGKLNIQNTHQTWNKHGSRFGLFWVVQEVQGSVLEDVPRFGRFKVQNFQVRSNTKDRKFTHFFIFYEVRTFGLVRDSVFFERFGGSKFSFRG